MESIISYFGTYTPAADGAAASFKFEYLCTLGFAAIVIFLGRAIVARSAPTNRQPTEQSPLSSLSTCVLSVSRPS